MHVKKKDTRSFANKTGMPVTVDDDFLAQTKRRLTSS
jgi:hypothetical protein